MVSAMPVSANVMAKVLLVPASAGFEVKLSVSHRGAAWRNQAGFERMVLMVCVGVVVFGTKCTVDSFSELLNSLLSKCFEI